MTSSFPQSSLTRSSSPRTMFNTAMTVVAFICGVLALLPLVAVLSYVLFKGFSSLNLSVFTELPPAPLRKGGGFGNAILGTLFMVGIGALISIPFGVLAAIYLTEFSSGKVARWIRFATNILSGVPSIIAGVFAYGIVVLTLVKLNLGSYSAFGGGFALAILMLPTIVRTTDESLQLVSQDLRQASVGLGATKFQTVIQVVLPAALPAIVTGSTLAIARASGETAPLLFTALFSSFWPSGLLQPTASLAVLVYNFSISPFQNWQSLAWAASLILVLMVLITSIIARLATRQKA
ncbi:phosphate ABC transporter permease PstA [Anabaena cylindrica FACHB-243]|uniref:Phosphate transport system permease protein PstA n=1 Tax=Anabaena cylindrica (strain ATCC 27899 / PCC 7122) TaxID=272123 RepID=K9ZPT9_ANACC|nr:MULTISPECIES: phosphate ABC transporter permease PstA [Anabaena]AFZ60809.1 phosphate ABC transporter membrane protein 2, PhoT family [Anabaena cylindrica PCC 7122]MBD2417109.1 phosphate ABC transporter permease PstA [Anabaena cylindrica FACHB-243]MBY5280805.1 phosphate ABC transporter permease PstA [Anabaena sp. CCAP 1446/1C]MBY5307081.1 phosphate ABC transporter permease PstA [Anabaena sp. CCAP 1446/1C]MCM2406810.1 phosphate ABC transporter permease PstA [Anabaena sp. CCAP 1446/1C]